MYAVHDADARVRRAHDDFMKAKLPIERRPIVPRHREELRGPRRTRPPRRHGIRTRCGYLLFRTFV